MVAAEVCLRSRSAGRGVLPGLLAAPARYKDKHIRDITLDDLQAIIDEDAVGGKSKSTLNNDKILMRALLKYAMKRNIIMKDYSEFVELPTVEAKFEKGALTDLLMHKLETMAKMAIRGWIRCSCSVIPASESVSFGSDALFL